MSAQDIIDPTALGRPDFELSVLGRIIETPTDIHRAGEILSAGDFSSDEHGHVYAAVGDILLARGAGGTSDGDGISAAELDAHLSAAHHRPNAFHWRGLIEAARDDALAPGLALAPVCHAIRALARRRALARAAGQTQADLAAGRETDPDASLDTLDHALDAIRATAPAGAVAAFEATMSALSELEKKSKAGAGIPGVLTGLPNVDDALDGLRPGNMIIIGASTGVGKTDMAIQVAAHNAHPPGDYAGAGVGLISCEMTMAEIMSRIILRAGGTTERELRGDDRAEAWKMVAEGAGVIADEWKMHIADLSLQRPDITAIQRHCRALKNRNHCGVIIVDYLQKISHQHLKWRTAEQATAEKSSALKRLAIELQVPVIALAQLNRSPSSGGSPREPRLSDLRDSGAIEQDADVVILLSRPPDEEGVLQIDIAKSRHGPCRKSRAAYRPQLHRIFEE